MVVHGQIILNQFKNFPKKSVANSAFVGGLKAKMELRRHCKLYTIPKSKARLRVRSPPLQVTGSPALLTWRLSAQCQQHEQAHAAHACDGLRRHDEDSRNLASGPPTVHMQLHRGKCGQVPC